MESFFRYCNFFVIVSIYSLWKCQLTFAGGIAVSVPGFCHKGSSYDVSHKLYFPIQGSCNQYLQCNKENMGYILTCAAGTFYDGHLCKHADKFKCKYDPCMNQYEGFKYGDGQSCYGYYQCSSGQSKYRTCLDGTYFNYNQQACLLDPSCTSRNLEHPCSQGTTLPFPGYPSMFYLTDHSNSLFPMKCPDGLVYNSNVCACDWVLPGVSGQQSCQPLFHFRYSGNFLEMENRVQQVPTSAVSVHKNSAYFSEGGSIVIWAMQNLQLGSEFALCFEFLTTKYKGEIALISNDFKNFDFSFKITYIPELMVVKLYIALDDGRTLEFSSSGVFPMKPHFVRVAKNRKVLTLRVDNLPPVVSHLESEIKTKNYPFVVGKAGGCNGFIGHFDELKFFKCIPDGFLDEYEED